MEQIDVAALAGIREPFCSLSHMLAAPIFALMGYFLVRKGRGLRANTISLTVMAFSAVFLLVMSSIYHLLPVGPARAQMRQVDVAAVFLLISGTATPLHAILFRGVLRWAPLWLMWIVAFSGIILRTLFEGQLPKGVGTALFLVMGWGGLFSFFLLWRRFNLSFVSPLLLGGLAYTIGALVHVYKWPTLIPDVIGPHELWHVAVLVGLILHWHFVEQFAGYDDNDLMLEKDAAAG